MLINPLDYQSHKNFEQIKAYRVAEMLGLEPEYLGGVVCVKFNGFGDERLHTKFNPNTYSVMGELMEWLQCWPRCGLYPDDRWHCERLGDGWTKYATLSLSDSPIQAVILCALAVEGKVDVPEELLGNESG